MSRVRARLGLWLLKPRISAWYRHYAMKSEDDLLPDVNRERCTYMAIGIQSVARQSPQGVW